MNTFKCILQTVFKRLNLLTVNLHENHEYIDIATFV